MHQTRLVIAGEIPSILNQKVSIVPLLVATMQERKRNKIYHASLLQFFHHLPFLVWQIEFKKKTQRIARTEIYFIV
jgi:hypothetical protein